MAGTLCRAASYAHRHVLPLIAVSNLVADAIRLRSEPWADLPRVHPRLQLLDVTHCLPCDFVVHLSFRHIRGNAEESGHMSELLTTKTY